MSTCPKCVQFETRKADDHQLYTFTPHPNYEESKLIFTLDVEAGYAIARAAYENGERWRLKLLEPDARTESFVSAHEIVEEHLAHVSIDEPALYGLCLLTRKSTQQVEPVSLLLDGHHRSLRRVREGKDVLVYVLLPKEIARILWMTQYPECKLAIRWQRQQEANIPHA
jgi:hypothetical protein